MSDNNKDPSRPLDDVDPAQAQRVLDVLADTPERWRTAEGIAEEAGVSPHIVEGCMAQNPKVDRHPLSPGGKHLYRLREG
jgi:hypothetical protein